MKIAITVMTAVSMSLTCTALGNKYGDLAGQGYRWVLVDGPYACNNEQDAQRIVAHRTDATELQSVQNIQCYYLIPGTIVQVIREDAAEGMSQIRLGGIANFLWTYTRFLSKQPVRDTYGSIETPEEYGLLPNKDTAVLPLPSSSSTDRSHQSGAQ
jgi:hypothetical protein